MPNLARTDGTVRTFDETILKAVIALLWASGGTPKYLSVGPVNKARVSAFGGIATKTFNRDAEKPTAIIGSADVYVSDFGVHQVILNRYGRDSVVLCLDPSYWAIRFLCKPFKRELAKTGDAKKYQIITEWGLVARNWKASSKVVGCA